AVGRIADLGSLAHANTQRIDLQGKTLMPGFFDAHIHVWKVGDLLTFNLDLRGVGSIEEMQDKLRDFAAQHPELQWIRARGFNEAQLKEGRLPTRYEIDKVVTDRPVFLQRTCAHIAVINAKALEICGINAKTPVPFGGEIRLGTDGQPNGILCETALGLAMRHFPPTTDADYETMILAACRELLRHGVTAACDPAVMPDLLAVYQKMDREGRLPMRIHAVPIVLPDGGTEQLPLPALYESDNLVVNTVKFFADGGLSGQTGALSRPYKDSNSRGILRLDPTQFYELALKAQAKGFQVATHAIGDEAISLVINTYERLYQAQADAPRHRIEHLGLPMGSISAVFPT
ncbi:MAG: amidohydrolase, partial [Saprospiraceae bacterium]|nr:amidohydrolase [Saprospiraceae bacterium]